MDFFFVACVYTRSWMMAGHDTTFAVVLRGIIRGRAQCGRKKQHRVDATSVVLGNFMDRVVAPLLESGPDVRVQVCICTYAFPGLMELERDLRMRCAYARGRIDVLPVHVYDRPIETGTQLYAMRAAMHHVLRTLALEDVSCVFVCRPDTLWKCSICDVLGRSIRVSSVTYLFNERATLLRKNCSDLISDVFFAVPTPKLVHEFMAALEHHDCHTDLHGLYRSAKAAAANMNLTPKIAWARCHEDRFDSNTDNRTNPFYTIQRS